MRHFVSIVALLLLIGSVPAVTVTAQERSLLDLLPTAADLGPTFVVVDNRPRTLAEQATGFANADEAARQLAGWEWQENVFRVFQNVESTPTGAPRRRSTSVSPASRTPRARLLALPYFLSDRAAVLAQGEVKSQNLTSAADRRRDARPQRPGRRWRRHHPLRAHGRAPAPPQSYVNLGHARDVSGRDRASDRRPGHGPIASRRHHRHAACYRASPRNSAAGPRGVLQRRG